MYAISHFSFWCCPLSLPGTPSLSFYISLLCLSLSLSLSLSPTFVYRPLLSISLSLSLPRSLAPSLTTSRQTPFTYQVFCEKGVFELESTRAILEAGRALGLRPNIHADELSPLGGTELAVEMKSAGVSHLEHISDEAMKGMGEQQIPAVLLPTTAYILRIDPPPARKMIDAGEFHSDLLSLSINIYIYLLISLFL